MLLFYQQFTVAAKALSPHAWKISTGAARVGKGAFMIYYASLYLMAAAYTAAGLNHFRNPSFYLRIMPPYLPAHEFLVFASGVAEAGLGLALFFPATRVFAAWGIIALLVAVFPANLYMFQKGGAAFGGIPDWALLARLPLQLLLIAWAYVYTRA